MLNQWSCFMKCVICFPAPAGEPTLSGLVGCSPMIYITIILKQDPSFEFTRHHDDETLLDIIGLKRLCLELSKLTTRSGKYSWRLMSFVRENWCERQFIPGWCPNLFRYFHVLSKRISNLRLPKLPKLRLWFGKSFFSSSEMTQRKP